MNQTAHPDIAEVRALLQSRHPSVWIPTEDENEALEIVRAAMTGINADFYTWSAVDGLTCGIVEAGESVPDTNTAAAALTWLGMLDRPAIAAFLDLSDHLEDPTTRRAARQLIQRYAQDPSDTSSHLVLIDHAHAIHPAVAPLTTRHNISFPSAGEIEHIARSVLREINRRTPIHIEINRNTWKIVLKNLRGLRRRQIERVLHEAVAVDNKLTDNDINRILAAKRRMLSGGGMLEFVESPASLDEIGGLTRLKAWLAQREHAFTEKASDYGLTPPRGLLLLGVQGAGKSLCAKAIATAWQRPLLRMDPGGLYDRFIGESEKKLREALQQAEAMSPIVLWIDEIEKAFASAATHSTDGGLSQRMFGALLTWMQEHKEPVFLVATANNIDALPPELLRKGRFDEIFFVDLPGEEARKLIFKIHLKKRGRDPATYDTDKLAAVSKGFSGAEIEQAVVSALHAAFAANQTLTTEGLVKAIEETNPLSVTMRERIDALRKWAKDRCVPADDPD